jgi:hypothetical protein
MINRKQMFKAEEMNPVSRHYASDESARQPGASGMDVAREGYSVVDRADPRSYFGKLRDGVPTVRQVFDGPREDEDGNVYPHGGGVG